MSDEPSTLEVKRTTQVLEVMGLIFQDASITVEDACETIGIPPSTYYYWVKKDPDALRAVREYLAETQKLELAFLSAAITKINIGLARKAMSDDTEMADRLRAAKYLSGEAEKLQRVYQVTAGGEEAAEFLRDGPQLVNKKSRFASMSVTEEEGSVKVDFFRDDAVIEGVDVTEVLDEPD
jgi:hypothetical protein